MKAEILHYKEIQSYNVIITSNGLYLFGLQSGIHDKRDAEIIVDKFNSALASHIDSELSAKIEKIKEELSDEWIKQYLKDHTRTPSGNLPKKVQFIINVAVEATFISTVKFMRDEILNRLTYNK